MKQRIRTGKVGRRSSIKVKLLIIPLIVVLLVILGIGGISSYFTRESLLNGMKENGLATSAKFIDRMEDNVNASEAINGMFEDKIRAMGNVVKLSKDHLSDEFLKKLVDETGVHEISYYNSDWEVKYSNLQESIGWTPPEGHRVREFMEGSTPELIEEIRQDSESGHFVKFGYLRNDDGGFIQIGIMADKVQELTDTFSYQRLVDVIAADEGISYAMFIDQDLVAVAHSNEDERGTVFDDTGSIAAIVDGVTYADTWYYELEDVTVYDVVYPAVINGEQVGAFSIGYSMSNIQAAVQKNIAVAVISVIMAFGILGFVLYRSSNDAIKVINELKEQMGFMASGDFSNPIPQDLIDKTDEFGEISQAVSTMQNSVKDVIKSVIESSEQLAASSQDLTATSQQSAVAADEIARVIEDIANGASEQAKDTEQGALSISHLGDLVVQNKDDIQNLNMATEKVNTLKDQGLEIMKDLVEKTHINSQSSKEVQEIIIETNESADRIVSASEMIQSIAEQTNLLALNAAIEASRAGDAGRGFAVVADEIRKLAEQSNQFTSEISTIIKDLTDKTSSGVKTMEGLEQIVSSQSESVEMTNNKFHGIAEAIEEMQQLINRVGESSDEIAGKKEEVVGIIEQLSAISEENAAGTQEASASVEEQTASMGEIANSSEELARIAEELNSRVGQFII